MNLKAFGVTDPPVDANPTLARSNSLAFWKKAISFFMPNRLIAWTSGRNEGNPTRSIDVNNLIKRVKKKEVRKQGVASQCRRAITEAEFRTMQKILQNHDRNSLIWRYGLYALTNFQFHLLARIDDTTQVLVENLKVHDSFCNALKTRLNWSKNVSDERDAPWQVVLGSMDTAFCVFASLSLWMEINLRSNPNASLSPYLFGFCDDNSIPTGGQKSKETAHNIFSRIFKMEEFTAAGKDNLLGSHSIRKFAATHARRSGCTKDDKDIRGRWKSKARVSDVYEDTELPFPDAKVAEKLCIGGACYYLFPDELISNDEEVLGRSTTIAMLKTFILSNVVPNIRKRVSDMAALVLGKALLWLIYSPYNATNNIVPQEMKNRIQMEWNEIVSAGEGNNVDCTSSDYNPICRVPVVVTGDQGCVYIDVVPSFVEADGGEIIGGGRASTSSSTGGIQAQLLAIQSMSSQIRRELQEMRTNQMADRVFVAKNFLIVNSNIRRIALQPGLRGGTGTVARGNDDNQSGAPLAIAGLGIAPASLSPNPKNLFNLWQEYQIGIGGRKAAKLFNRSERGGKVKHKYSRRRVIWSTISGMVRLGLTADAAIDQIYAVYGQQTCVTKIINLMKKDKERGTLNPNLRV
jgi:hypothetical protein